ncbi:U3 small nucleolar RNA-associated protein [Spatholobus suberectus]|nr:U3 small nucleolar RNA-associated protein [Spatholobus suberectus]
MILNKEKEKPSTSNSPCPSIVITHLNFLLFFPPHNLCPFGSNSNINKPAFPNNLSSSSLSLLSSLGETMRRRPRTTFLASFLAIVTFATFSLFLSRNAISTWRPDYDIRKLNTNHLVLRNNNNNNNIVHNEFTRQTRRVSSIKDSKSTVSVLIPDWEILVIVAPNTPFSSSDQHHCLFPNDATSPAKFSGVLPFTNRTTFKCDMPESVRRRRLFSQPMLVTGTSEDEFPDPPAPAPELMRWNFLVYESFSAENDVVLFAKGVNHRRGYDRSPKELRCVFDLGNGIRNAVTSSVQEVFRCPHPDPSELSLDSYYGLPQRIGISLEIVAENIVVPSVAYYVPRPKPKPKPRM